MSPKRPALQPLPAVDAPADETVPPALAPAPATTPVLSPATAAPASQWKVQREHDPKEVVRKFGLVLALGFLAVSLVIAYYSANSILSIWFEYQYTPIVRLVMALVVAAISIWVVMRLTQRRPA